MDLTSTSVPDIQTVKNTFSLESPQPSGSWAIGTLSASGSARVPHSPLPNNYLLFLVTTRNSILRDSGARIVEFVGITGTGDIQHHGRGGVKSAWLSGTHVVAGNLDPPYAGACVESF